MSLAYTLHWEDGIVWLVVCGFIFSAALSFGMGANEIANSCGTSVGSGVLKLWQAYAFATVFETLGASLLGYKVANYFRKQVVHPDAFTVYMEDYTNGTFVEPPVPINQTEYDVCVNASAPFDATDNLTRQCFQYTEIEYVVGSVSALLAVATWNLIATLAKLPVSTTHSAVGAVVGFSLAVKGSSGINWFGVGKVVISWITSPIASGIIGMILYAITRLFILDAPNSYERSLMALPIYYASVVFVVVFAVLLDGSKYLHFDNIAIWLNVCISLAFAVIVGLVAKFVFVRMVKKWVEKSVQEQTSELPKDELQADNTVCEKIRHLITISPEPQSASMVYSALQVLSACFMAFTHGSNDIANAAGPLLAIWTTYETGYANTDQENDVTVQLMILYTCAAMVIGFWTLGYRTIKTVGKELTEVTPASGFCMEIATALTVLLCSKLGIPISATHCLVGSVVFVGWYRTRTVQWKIFKNVALAWIVTLPFSGLAAALISYLLLLITRKVY